MTTTPPDPAPTSRTPARLRRTRAGLVALVVLFGVLGLLLVNDLSRVGEQTSVRVQTVDQLGRAEGLVLQANTATRLALLSPPAQADALRSQAQGALQQAASLLVTPAAAGIEAVTGLPELNGLLLTHAQTLAAATGPEAGVQLQQADTQLQELGSGFAATQAPLGVVGTVGALPMVVLVVATAVLVGAIGWASRMLARHSHRVLNLGLMLALLGVGTLAWLLGATLSGVGGGQVAEVDQTVALNRTANRLLEADLIQVRAFQEHAWPKSAQLGYQQLVSDATTSAQASGSSIAGFEKSRENLTRALSDTKWDAALTQRLATDPEAAGPWLDSFVATTRESSIAQATEAGQSGGSGGVGLIWVGVSTAALALATAAALGWGIGLRLREYR